MILTIVLFVSYLTNTAQHFQTAINYCRKPKMSISTSDRNPNRQLGTLHPTKQEEMSLEQLQALNVAAAAEALEAAETAAIAKFMPSLFFAKEIGEISGKTEGLREENNRLRDEIKALEKKIETLLQENEAKKSQNQKLNDTIRVLESSRDKLQKDLERVKTANDTLRIEIEEKTAKNSKENQILTEKLEVLTSEFEAVENENKELKRILEELTDRLASEINSNHSLKQTVDSIRKENQQLKDEFGDLKAEHQQIRKKLECKETKLALGQVAWLLEKEIWKAVLPNQRMGKTGIFRSMNQWLKRNSSKDEGKEAQKRWDDLKAKLNWDENDHKYGLKQLKDIRNEEAHPEGVDLEVARKELKEGDYVADADKDICEEIIDMVITARKLNSSNF